MSMANGSTQTPGGEACPEMASEGLWAESGRWEEEKRSSPQGGEHFYW